jgi:hypothetical protein
LKGVAGEKRNIDERDEGDGFLLKADKIIPEMAREQSGAVILSAGT